MLIYESEGFLAVDEESVQSLFRSKHTISLVPQGDDPFEFQALLCLQIIEGEQRCCCAFHCRALKRTLVFAVKSSSEKDPVQGGLQILNGLGLEMEPVNINFSPALRQVVLRDIPGLLSIEEARKQRTEKSSQRADLERVLQENPESAAGKKAKLKLNTEQRLDEKAAALRELLIEQFAPAGTCNADVQVLASQIEDLTARLEKSDELLGEERSQRELAEKTIAAAEKRIQELEQILVEADTQKSDVVKSRQKIVQLESRITKLTSELETVSGELEVERGKQKQLVDDVQAAHARAETLEKDLADATEIAAGAVEAEDSADKAESRIAELQVKLQEAQGRADEEVAARKALQQSLEEAQDQCAGLEKDLEQVKQDNESTVAAAAQQAEEMTVRVEALTVEMEQTRTALKAESEAKEVLQRQLAEQVASLEKQLAETDVYHAEAAETETRMNAAKQQIDALTAELEVVKAEAVAAQTIHETLKEELVEARSAAKRLEKDLQAAEKDLQKAASAREQITAFRQRLEALDEEQETAREELAQERNIRKRLEKGALEAEKRIRELENQLADGESELQMSVQSKTARGDRGAERLKTELKETLARVAEETEIREKLEAEVDEAHAMIETLEKALKGTKDAKRAAAENKSVDNEAVQFDELAEKLKVVEAQLEQELLENRKSAGIQSAAEKRIAELEERLVRAEASTFHPAGSKPVPEHKTDTRKPLPHDQRPAPKKGALFHPDWDLEGLPCRSVDQVLEAWESVYNVQLSLEGYPSQYCSAFLVVLKAGKRKSLYMLFKLKKDKHTLVCVPAKVPTNEAALKKTVEEGKKYLQLSGFELEALSPKNMEGALGGYFVGQ